VIYDLYADRRKPSLAEERGRLLNMCRLFGIPIALDVQTVPENGGIGICEPVSLYPDLKLTLVSLCIAIGRGAQ